MGFMNRKRHRGSCTGRGWCTGIWLAALLGATSAASSAEIPASMSAQIDSLEVEREDLQRQLDQVDAALDSLRTPEEEAAEPPVTTAVPINDEIGEEINATERQKYSLFPGVSGFVSAAYFRKPDGAYFIRLRREGDSGVEVERVNSVSLAGINFVRATIKKQSD